MGALQVFGSQPVRVKASPGWVQRWTTPSPINPAEQSAETLKDRKCRSFSYLGLICLCNCSDFLCLGCFAEVKRKAGTPISYAGRVHCVAGFLRAMGRLTGGLVATLQRVGLSVEDARDNLPGHASLQTCGRHSESWLLKGRLLHHIILFGLCSGCNALHRPAARNAVGRQWLRAGADDRLPDIVWGTGHLRTQALFRFLDKQSRLAPIVQCFKRHVLADACLSTDASTSKSGIRRFFSCLGSQVSGLKARG